MTANEMAGNSELKRKECSPSLKPQSYNMSESQVMHTSVRNDWQKSSLHVASNTSENKDLSRCVISMGGSEPRYTNTSPCSMNETGLMVEELTVRKYRSLNFDSASSPNVSRQGECQYPYQLASGSRRKGSHGESALPGKDQMMLSARVELKRMASGIRSLKTLSGKQIDQAWKDVSAHIRDGDNRTMTSNRLPIGGAQLKTLSSPGFPQVLFKKTSKGKEVVCRNPEAPSGFGGAVARQNAGKLGYVTEEASDAFLNSVTNNDQLSSHRSRTDESGVDSAHNGISLREWLKHKSRKEHKVESLCVFKQIVDLVAFAHSQGFALQDFRPSCLILLPSSKVKYTGSSIKRGLESVMHGNLALKNPLGKDVRTFHGLVAKQQKLSDDMKLFNQPPQFTTSCGTWTKPLNEKDFCITDPQYTGCPEHHAQDNSSHQCTSIATQQESISLIEQSEEKWYTSPEEISERGCTFSSNIYGLGVLLFELLCYFESWEVHSAAMMDLRHRILPPNFLSENPKEAGFCIWLLHPEPSSRPTARVLLQSELIRGPQGWSCGDDFSISTDGNDAESELLLDFLVSFRKQKLKRASQLVEDIECLEDDIKEVESRYLLSASSVSSLTCKEFPNVGELQGPVSSCVISKLPSTSDMNESRLMRNIRQLENAYFSMRSQIQLTERSIASRCDKDLLKNRERWSHVQKENEEPNINPKSDCLGAFFEGLSKFARYRKFEVRGIIRSGDLLKSANVICSLSLNRDEDYFASAGVSKKIKVFEFGALLDDSIDIHYPVIEMSNESKLSCVCWNNYIKNYLASTDYDGVVQMWDAGSGQRLSQYMEHQKRAWSVDFSQADPTKFASGSDDCTVKLWSINERSSIGTIWNSANVCCVQFSSYSTNLLVFGSADYKLYCYDLRNTRIPWCTLDDHGKAVSYVKFLDSETLVSASTDNTLKLWDLNKTCSAGLSSNACRLTFSGHTNAKNFVGLSVLDGYIACGSETNEVYSYYRSFPMPITSHKFGSTDPFSGDEVEDDNRQFVSSVCWSGKSNIIVAANSSGSMKLLQMV